MLFTLFLTSLIISLVSAQTSNPIVRVSHGDIQGLWKLSTNRRTYASFQSIPYAEPPIGNYRYQEPQQLQPWSGVWNATMTSPACLQYHPFEVKIIGSENCLFLNIYTPRLNPDAMLPVMIYIHGGGFVYGESGTYGEDNLMDWDIVVVTINYRLGPLGFLSTGDDVVPGNNGLKDQLFALRWVKQYIVLFGGNPDGITLSGQSAGGVSVHYHFLSPMSRGLFNRGISFSGSAFSSWALDIKPVQKSQSLASLLGCPTVSSKELIDCLKKKPAEDIVNAQIEMLDWRVRLFSPFTPVIEAPEIQEAFIQQCPFQATKTGSMMKLPLLATVTSEEGLYSAAALQRDPTILPELETKWDQLASFIFLYNDTLPVHRRPEIAQRIKHEYLDSKPVSQETFDQLVKALGDRIFFADVGKLVQMHADNSGQPTHMLKYSYRGSWSITHLMIGNNIYYGVSHADKVLRIFKTPGLDTVAPAERAMMEELINIIYSFSVSGIPKLNNTKTVWLPVEPGSKELHYLNVLSAYRTEMKSSTDFGHKSFWDQLGFNENENYQVKCL